MGALLDSPAVRQVWETAERQLIGLKDRGVTVNRGRLGCYKGQVEVYLKLIPVKGNKLLFKQLEAQGWAQTYGADRRMYRTYSKTFVCEGLEV